MKEKSPDESALTIVYAPLSAELKKMGGRLSVRTTNYSVSTS